MSGVGERRLAGGLPPVLVVLLLAGCAFALTGPPPSSVTPPAVPAATATVTHGGGGEPSFEVRYAETALELPAVSFCTSGGGVGRCVDGVDADPPRIGSPPEVFVHVSVAEFRTLEVSQASETDSSQLIAQVEPLGGQWWRVRPPRAGPGPTGSRCSPAGTVSATWPPTSFGR